MTRPLPTSSTATFSARSTCIIPASASATFNVLSDLTSYSWNSFTPRITIKIKDPHIANSIPKDTPPILPIGTKLILKVKLLLPFPILQKEKISQWDVQGKRIAWSQDVVPDWMG